MEPIIEASIIYVIKCILKNTVWRQRITYPVCYYSSSWFWSFAISLRLAGDHVSLLAVKPSAQNTTRALKEWTAPHVLASALCQPERVHERGHSINASQHWAGWTAANALIIIPQPSQTVSLVWSTISNHQLSPLGWLYSNVAVWTVCYPDH